MALFAVGSGGRLLNLDQAYSVSPVVRNENSAGLVVRYPDAYVDGDPVADEEEIVTGGRRTVELFMSRLVEELGRRGDLLSLDDAT